MRVIFKQKTYDEYSGWELSSAKQAAKGTSTQTNVRSSIIEQDHLQIEKLKH